MNPEDPTVSIILPAYNSESFIKMTLLSVFNQEYDDYEIIVVDDGSTDNTSKILSEMKNRIKYIRQDNKGIAEARNTGLRYAKGRYIAFIDHDDYWHPKKLSVQVEALNASDLIFGVCFGEFMSWNSEDVPDFSVMAPPSSHWSPSLSGWIYHRLLLTNWVLFTTALFRREVFDSIGKFDPEMPPADDWDIALRASRQFKFIKLTSVLALYRQHMGQTSRQPPVRDFQSELRESMILRYGLSSKDGSKPKPRELRERRIQSRLSFVSAHLASGSLLAAALAWSKALRLSPIDGRVWRTAVSFVTSLARRRIETRSMARSRRQFKE